MPNLTSTLNDHVRRLARREVNALTKVTRRLTAQHRRDIAALKRQVAALRKTVAFLEAQEKRRVARHPAPQHAEGVRFRADGLKSHRARLGLSAADYGRLVGASGLSVYHWESGKARPRKEQVAKLASVRGIGKREAVKRLEMLDGSNGAAGAPRSRSSGSQPARDFVLMLVRGKKAGTSKEINEAWRKAGRPGKADNTLSLMVRAGHLKRTKAKGERGSTYAPVA